MAKNKLLCDNLPTEVLQLSILQKCGLNSIAIPHAMLQNKSTVISEQY